MASFGIDFGTTNSLIVSYDRKNNRFYPTHPQPESSTIMYNDEKIIIGNEAREKMHKYEGIEGYHFEKSIKLKLGTNHFSNIFGKDVKPAEIAMEIIKNLKKKVVNITTAVFTVPINFSGKARRDMRKAANDAGIEITTFIHEPFAAIVGYYFTKNSNTTCDEVLAELIKIDDKYILTFDWGGGTLDITVVHVKEGKMFEVGTAELTNMAGDKFDELLATHVWNKFCEKMRKYERYTDDYLEKVRKEKWGKLLAEAERRKIDLSNRDKSNFFVEAIIDDEDLDETITREDFETIISDVLDKALNRVDEAIKQADINPVQISHVLLTGGTCYIPMVKKRMTEKFGSRVEEVKGADLLIAQGAAIISELGWKPYLSKAVSIQMCDNSFFDLFEQDVKIVSGKGNTKEEEFVCVDQRRKNAKVIIRERFDGEAGKTLAILNVPTLGNANFGDEIIVSGTIDRDIVLTVKAHSKFVNDVDDPDEKTIEKVLEIYKLCFGLEIDKE